ncbi:MAG TPA: hypothetical protein VI911_04255 [Patescibacteria group bacterium]|nr:hypothetical protein [Patescibacteria group bacterium]
MTDYAEREEAAIARLRAQPGWKWHGLYVHPRRGTGYALIESLAKCPLPDCTPMVRVTPDNGVLPFDEVPSRSVYVTIFEHGTPPITTRIPSTADGSEP